MKALNIIKTLKSLVVAGAIIGSTSLMADGASSYKKCSACHGVNAEKAALGKSKVINAMSEQELTEAINGYKDGTYGGPMKGLMKGQVTSLDDAQIEEIAKFLEAQK